MFIFAINLGYLNIVHLWHSTIQICQIVTIPNLSNFEILTILAIVLIQLFQYNIMVGTIVVIVLVEYYSKSGSNDNTKTILGNCVYQRSPEGFPIAEKKLPTGIITLQLIQNTLENNQIGLDYINGPTKKVKRMHCLTKMEMFLDITNSCLDFWAKQITTGVGNSFWLAGHIGNKFVLRGPVIVPCGLKMGF